MNSDRTIDTDAPEMEDPPGIAIRRHHDRCFHAVEEVVPPDSQGYSGGFIVEGVLIDRQDVAQIRDLDPVTCPSDHDHCV